MSGSMPLSEMEIPAGVNHLAMVTFNDELSR